MLAGVGIALPRYIPIYRNSNPPRRIAPLLGATLLYIIGISIAVFAISMLFSTQMQNVVIGQSGNMDLLLIALAYAFSLAIAQYAYAYYRGIGNFKWYNGAQLAVQLSIVMPLIFIPLLTVRDIFLSWFIITIILVVFFGGHELWLFRKGEGSFATDAHLRTIAKYSSGRLVADFFQFSLSAFPLIYISNTQGLHAAAYYSVGIFFVTMVTPLFSFMGIILLPYVSECIAKGERHAADQLVNRLAILYLGTSLITTAILYLFTGFFTRLLFAESYMVANDITRIMILSILPQAFYLLYRNPIDAVSVVPYNTIILGICLSAIVGCFVCSSTLPQFAWAYFGVSALQGVMSYLTWKHLKNNKS
jgi:O-antigen/teichoic acid export membrane protein